MDGIYKKITKVPSNFDSFWVTLTALHAFVSCMKKCQFNTKLNSNRFLLFGINACFLLN